ncbi:restriction endonuclease subunit S [Vibrio campbellii]
MSAEKLITDHIDIWTSAVQAKSASGRGSGKKRELYGIKKLRELILELAVRGKLMPQDPNDEPASVLLERIAAEKAQLVKEKKIKKSKALPVIEDGEKPFELPQGWEWVKIGQICNVQAGFAFKSKDFNEVGFGMPLIRIRDVGQEFSGTFFSGDYRSEFVVERGDYLISMDGNFRVATWLGEPALLNQRVSRLQFFRGELEKSYIAASLQFKLTKLQGVKAYTTVDHLSGGQISNSVIALPPLAEQHRIVAKVDELMSLCDQLEQQTEASLDAHQVLVETLLATLTNSQDADDLMANWARISEHFDTLFPLGIKGEQSIDQLKQTILQLAVMGKLVPQDPNDEPAAKLLERIAIEKAQLVKEKKIKKQKALPPIAEDEKPFELPKGWEWCRVAAMMEPNRDISYGIIKLEAEPEEDGIPTLRCSDVKPRHIDLSGVRTVSREIEEPYARTRLTGGEVLVNIRGTLGGVALAPVDLAGYNIAREVAMLPVHESVDGNYLVNLIAAPFFWEMIESNLKGIAYKGLNLNILRDFVVPVPPEREQYRIVAKVDELMALCDQLKQRLRHSQQTQLQLTDAIVEQAL